jgi:hypothetical protein
MVNTNYTDEQMNKIARAVTWMIEHNYWQDHLIWERDGAIVDICTKYFTFQDCAAVAFVIRQYLKQLLGDKFSRRQYDINDNMFITKFKNNVEVYSALGPNSLKGISNGGGGYGRYGKNGFAYKFTEHFHQLSTKDWALYQREKRYFDTFGLCSWEDPEYPRERKKPGRKKKNANG